MLCLFRPQRPLREILPGSDCDDSEAGIKCSQICFNLAYAPISNVDVISFLQTRNSSPHKEKGQPSPGSSTDTTPEILFPPATESYAAAKWIEVKSIMGLWKEANAEQEHQTITRGSSYADVPDDHEQHLHADDLCIKLQTGTNRVASPTKNLLIVLDNTQSCRHYIYYPSDQTQLNLGKTSTSLMEMLSSSSEHPIGNIPQLHRIRIARSLVMAVLQFHATPWLTESWQSNNLLFENANPKNWQSCNASPHLVVHIAGANKKAPVPSTIAQPSLSLAAFVPNSMLFNLGVMLLELAYDVPFPSLLQSAGVDALADNILGDYNAAYQLASNVGVFFGSGYADVVRKCLRCDFREGEDLDNPALQERLYEDVICRLERMEDGIRKSQGEI